MNTEMGKAKVCFKANKLSLKTSKTKFYLLHSLKKTLEIPENRPLFMINNIGKKPAKVTKFLGVFLAYFWRIFGSKHFVETSY